MSDIHALAPTRIAVAIDVVMSEVDLMADRLFLAGASAVAERVRSDGSVTLIADLEVGAIDRFNEALSTTMASGASATSGAQAADTPRPDLTGRGGSTLRAIEPDVAWNNGWRDFARARGCGRIVIRPAWLGADSPVVFDGPGGAERSAGDSKGPVVELVMEPGVSFGSGSHVTTRLCVEAVDRLVSDGATVLDIGCGTGVLGVAAALLGSGHVTAVDIDPEAVRVTRSLAGANGVADLVEASTTPLADVAGQFDLVLVNVLITVIEELGSEMAGRVAPGGHLVACGVLVEQQARVEAAMEGLVLEQVESRDGWLLLEFTRPPA